MSDLLAHCSWPLLPARYAVALRAAVAFVLGEVDAIGVVATGTIVRGMPHASSDLDLYVIHEAPVRRGVQRYFGDPAVLRARYAAATRFEDATDIADEDPATASMLLGRAVTAMLELWCRMMTGTVPRGKDLLARVAALDPGLGGLAQRVFSDAPFPERHAAAAEVADRTIGVRGFFEWDSGPEPVPSRPR